MSKDPIEDHFMLITCAGCGRHVKKTIKWIRSNSSLQCEVCKSDIDLTDKEWVTAVDAFERDLKELMETPKNLKILNSDKD